jgi:hypothetical protein
MMPYIASVVSSNEDAEAYLLGAFKAACFRFAADYYLDSYNTHITACASMDGQTIGQFECNDAFRTSWFGLTSPDISIPYEVFTEWRFSEYSVKTDEIVFATDGIGLISPSPCLIPADPLATLPSGDPIPIPTYDDLLDAINTARTTNGAPALNEDSGLVIATAIHAQWMLDQNTITETGINGSTPLERAHLSGYAGGGIVGEVRGVTSIAMTPVESLLADWLADPATAVVLLGVGWTRIGGYILPWPGVGSIACVLLGTEPPES